MENTTTHDNIDSDLSLPMRVFVKGLVSAIIGGVVNSVAQAQTSAPIDSEHIARFATAGALLGGFSYMVGHLHGQSMEKSNQKKQRELLDGAGDEQAGQTGTGFTR